MRTPAKRYPARIGLALTFVAALSLAGCLIMEASHTLYLEEDGSVTWTVLERDVRSDEKKEWNRWEEEGEYLDGIRSGEHILQGFDDLGALSIDSYFVRPRRPYTFLAEGRFESIDGLIQAMIDETGIPAVVELDTWRRWSRLVVTVDMWAVEDWDEDIDEDEGPPALDLLGDLLWADDFQLLLAEGRFVDALHFSIEDSGTRAVPEYVGEEESEEEIEEEIEAAGGFLTFCLMWTQAADLAETAPPFASCGDLVL